MIEKYQKSSFSFFLNRNLLNMLIKVHKIFGIVFKRFKNDGTNDSTDHWFRC